MRNEAKTQSGPQATKRQGGRNACGAGNATPRRTRTAHRLGEQARKAAWMLARGPIPEGSARAREYRDNGIQLFGEGK